MTTQITLTMDDSVIDSAEKYAEQSGKSLSDLVENYLKAIAVHKPSTNVKFSPAVERLKGAIHLPDDFDYKKELTEALEKKYLRDR